MDKVVIPFEQQLHHMQRQATMLAEEGHDISSQVMADCATAYAAEHKRAEDASYQLGLMNAGSYQSQAAAWEKIYTVMQKCFGDGWWDGRGMNAADCAVAKIQELASIASSKEESE